jgi:two-component system, NarL family, response regulator DevR
VQGYGSKTLRVFLLDDHDIVRRGLRDLLASARDISVVGETDSAERAPRMIQEMKPDVMVLDVHLQDGTGIEVCRRVRSVDAGIQGLLLTSASDDEAMVAAILAGAAGYLIKLSASVEVTGAVRRVGSGRSLFDPAERDRVIERLRTELTLPENGRLTDGARAVLAQVLDGHTDADIADQLGMPVEEVASRIGHLVETLTGLSSSPGLGAGKHRRPER